MAVQIGLDYEFNEVLRAFPIVRRTLTRDLHFSLLDVREGESIGSYFKRKSLAPEEMGMVLRKVNFKLNRFLTKKVQAVEAIAVHTPQPRYETIYDAESEEEEE